MSYARVYGMYSRGRESPFIYLFYSSGFRTDMRISEDGVLADTAAIVVER